jgi:hypothetical protein
MYRSRQQREKLVRVDVIGPLNGSAFAFSYLVGPDRTERF